MNNELMHYGVKGMKWGVRREQKRTALNKYRKEYFELNKNASRANRTINRLAGSDLVYARAKYASTKDIKTTGIGSGRAITNKATAAGRVAAFESYAKNRGAKKSRARKDREANRAREEAYELVVDEFKAKRAYEKAVKKIGKLKVSDLPAFEHED